MVSKLCLVVSCLLLVKRYEKLIKKFACVLPFSCLVKFFHFSVLLLCFLATVHPPPLPGGGWFWNELCVLRFCKMQLRTVAEVWERPATPVTNIPYSLLSATVAVVTDSYFHCCLIILWWSSAVLYYLCI